MCAQCSSWLAVGVKTLPSSGFPLSNPLLSAGRAVPTVLYVEQLRKAPQKTPPHLEEVQLIHITWVWATRGSKSPTESKSCVWRKSPRRWARVMRMGWGARSLGDGNPLYLSLFPPTSLSLSLWNTHRNFQQWCQTPTLTRKQTAKKRTARAPSCLHTCISLYLLSACAHPVLPYKYAEYWYTNRAVGLGSNKKPSCALFKLGSHTPHTTSWLKIRKK